MKQINMKITDELLTEWKKQVEELFYQDNADNINMDIEKCIVLIDEVQKLRESIKLQQSFIDGMIAGIKARG